jgi:NAD(P)-dependent dehydrogenase (short-subunit alcohol dehydrogenase family)
MADRVKDKVALVIGAGSCGPGWGNGKAAAVLYAREGAKVFGADIQIVAARETRDIITGEGGECTVCEADVTNSTQVAAMVAQCLATYGRIDILHNNVGILDAVELTEMTEENWDKVMAVNVKGMFLSCKACLPHMEKQGSGAIVNISSVASMRYTGYPSAAYNASKGAVNQLTQNIALQYADRGIRANCVVPGLMHTPMIDASVASGYGLDEVEEMIKVRDAACPTGKMGNAWDVAYAALFLASDEARYITGANLVVDGGITCKMS